MWDLQSATCNMVDVRNTAGGVRDSGEFKLPVGIVNKTWPLDAFNGALAVIRLTAISCRIQAHFITVGGRGRAQCITVLCGYFHNNTCAAVVSRKVKFKFVFPAIEHSTPNHDRSVRLNDA
jgi:hypothetical protein